MASFKQDDLSWWIMEGVQSKRCEEGCGQENSVAQTLASPPHPTPPPPPHPIVKLQYSSQVDEGSFERVKEALVRKYENANLNVDRHATYLRLRCLKQIWEVSDTLAEIKALQPQDIQVPPPTPLPPPLPPPRCPYPPPDLNKKNPPPTRAGQCGPLLLRGRKPRFGILVERLGTPYYTSLFGRIVGIQTYMNVRGGGHLRRLTSGCTALSIPATSQI